MVPIHWGNIFPSPIKNFDGEGESMAQKGAFHSWTALFGQCWHPRQTKHNNKKV